MSDLPKRAGWYPDPDGVPGERWWNGAGWSDSRRGGAVPETPVYGPPVVYSAENPAPQAPGAPTGALRSAVTVNAKLNPMAMYAFIAGLISIFANILLVPGILAIVFAIRGLGRANQLHAAGETTTLKNFALIGLVLGIAGCVWALIQFAIFLASFIGSFSVDFS